MSRENALDRLDQAQRCAAPPHSDRAPLNETWIRHYWKQAAREMGKGELRLHDLRHAYAIFASDAGGQALLAAKRTPADPQVISLPLGAQPPAPSPDHRRGKRRARLLAEHASARLASGDMSAETL